MLNSSSSSLIGRLSGLSAFWACQFLLLFAAECGGVRSGVPPVGGSRANMDSSAAIDDETGAPDDDGGFPPTPNSWCASERCETASVDRSAWFDCRSQSCCRDPALIPNGTGPCPGLNALPPTLEPPSELGDPVSGIACMRE